jgi:hypothetical protein
MTLFSDLLLLYNNSFTSLSEYGVVPMGAGEGSLVLVTMGDLAVFLKTTH